MQSHHTTSTFRHSPALTIRWATPADADRLEILAELDEAPIPAAPVLLAFVGEELWAARSLHTQATIADPFRPSAEVSGLLAERGRQLTLPEGRLRLGALRLRRHSSLRVRAHLSHSG
ncbi:MAG: hypothetical protein JO244_11730 [Solirubrobacterales bacterium]|nr:hypothetical protein [Solirubrobacterales bacterium]